MTIVPIYDICRLPLTEVLQILQEEIEEVKQEVALAHEERDEFLETSAQQTLAMQRLEAMLASPWRSETPSLKGG
jgi:hypothetical protein